MIEIAIRVSDVSVRYLLTREKPKTLQEYLIQKIKGRKVKHEDFWALKKIHIEVPKGEALGIIGSNGAGKSTLLKVIAGVLKPTEGEVSVSGKIAPLIELGAGFDDELTGVENIYLNASIMGLSKKEIDRIFLRIVDFSELQDFIYTPLKSYSSGMVARLGFSIATEVDPAVLIIDEILAVGDEHFRRKCAERIAHFREKGVTMLYVSHGMAEIGKICNKVLWLDHGLARMYAEPKTVIDAYVKSLT